MSQRFANMCFLLFCVSFFFHSPPDPLRYHPPVSPSVPAPVPTAGPPYYPGQTVYPPSPPIIVPTPQQPPPAKREKKTVSILVVPMSFSLEAAFGRRGYDDDCDCVLLPEPPVKMFCFVFFFLSWKRGN